MAGTTSVDAYSFVATFELVASGQSWSLSQIAPEFVILRQPATVPPGPAELVTHFDDRPELRQQIEVVGPSDRNPDQLVIRRPV